MPDNSKYRTAKDFLAAIKPHAEIIEQRCGIPWLMTATQAAHESRNGNSGLAAHNNLFGVTGDGELKNSGVPDTMAMVDVKAWLVKHPGCPIILMKTNEQSPYPPEKIHYWSRPGDIITKTPHGAGSDVLAERPFRTYTDWDQALAEWSHKIMQVYPKAFIHAHDGEADGFFDELQAGGYATDPQYAAQLKTRYAEMGLIA